ncbi:hypothetical protein [Haloferax sp. Q22]|uniref:hypothetical protein n=1 Tax=Haloferax sp. (strain Q22) TaxID=1526048 RepID=UPI0012FA70AE|nr:hypothetical protein [Haloferax sp. Q22]
MTSEDTESKPPGLDSIYVRNQRTQETETLVTVSRDGDSIYEKSHTLDGKSTNSYGEVLIEEDWLGEQTSYKIEISAEGVGEESFSTGDFLEYAGGTEGFDCYEVTVVVDTDSIGFRPAARENCRN